MEGLGGSSKTKVQAPHGLHRRERDLSTRDWIDEEKLRLLVGSDKPAVGGADDVAAAEGRGGEGDMVAAPGASGVVGGGGLGEAAQRRHVGVAIGRGVEQARAAEEGGRVKPGVELVRGAPRAADGGGAEELGDLQRAEDEDDEVRRELRPIAPRDGLLHRVPDTESRAEIDSG